MGLHSDSLRVYLQAILEMSDKGANREDQLWQLINDYLAAKTAEHETDCLQGIIRIIEPQLYGFLRRRCDNETLVRDLMPEVLERSLRRTPKLRRTGSIMSWFLRIAYHVWVSELRKPWRRYVSSIDPAALENAESKSEPDVAKRDLARALLERLDEKTRTTLVMRFIEEIDVEDIAAISGKSVGATKMEISRSLRKAREAAKQLESDEKASRS